MSKTEKQRVGELGEDIASKFLMKHDYSVIERNYRKKFGEIDIISRKNGVLHFVEVKSVSRNLSQTVTRGTKQGGGSDSYRPEDNLHPWKLKRLSNAIETYLLERKVPHETEWQLDAITVLIDEKRRVGRVKLLENIVI